jgi:membrane associated rhomboid family serine protease
MTETPEEPGLPPMPPALARAVALQLVTRNRLRLADKRDSRLGDLAPDYELSVAGWTGSVAALVGFYDPPDEPEAARADLSRRLEAAARWGAERLSIQGAQRCDILLVASAEVGRVAPPPAPAGVSIGAAWADAGRGEAGELLPAPKGLPGTRELRAAARGLRDGAEAPTLAAVDLAERTAVREGTVVPVRRQMLTTPAVTIGLIASFVGVYLVENYLSGHYQDGLFGAGALAASACDRGGFVLQGPHSGCFGQPGGEWWRYVSAAFLHLPGGVLSLHLLMNSFSMFTVGRVVEQLYGRLMLLGLFVLTAIAGNVVTVAAWVGGLPGAAPSTIGASGGICGLLGLLLVLGRRQGRGVPVGLSRALQQSVLISAALTLFIGFTIANVNNYAHAGGFLAGAALGLVLPPVPAIGGRDLRTWEKALLIGGIVLGAVALVFAAVNLLQFLQTASPLLFPGP